MNPFTLKPTPLERTFFHWKRMYPLPYDKRATDPYTKTRIILMNGTERGRQRPEARTGLSAPG